MSSVIITTQPIFFPCTIYIRAMVNYIHLAKFQSEQVVLSLLCLQYQPLLRKAEFSQIIEKYHMALDQ
jgi:hypothetical protein